MTTPTPPQTFSIYTAFDAEGNNITEQVLEQLRLDEAENRELREALKQAEKERDEWRDACIEAERGA